MGVNRRSVSVCVIERSLVSRRETVGMGIGAIQPRLSPILSSRERTIRALSPGSGFNSSLGSKFGLELFFSCSGCCFSSCFRSRASSNAAMSSEEIVIAVGFRRSILRDLIVLRCLPTQVSEVLEVMCFVGTTEGMREIRCPVGSRALTSLSQIWACRHWRLQLHRARNHDSVTVEADCSPW